MPRDRYKYKHMKKDAAAVSSSEAPEQAPAVKPSSTALKVIERIAQGGEDYVMENGERILIDSASLAEEPEFKDLYLNKEKTAQVTERWLKRYEARLSAAEKVSEDEFHQVFDDVRIKILDELITPLFRKQVHNRLDALRNRMMPSNDARMLEVVLVTGSLLRMKKLPWGICGLIIEIYNRTMTQTLEEMQAESEIFADMVKVLEEEGEEITDPMELLESPEKFERASTKLLDANPELLERLEKHADEIIESFESALFDGKVPLPLFTEAELLLPFQRIEEEFGQSVNEMQPGEERLKIISETVTSTIREMMTPERYQRLRKDVETTAKTWMSERNKWAAALQIELDWLEGEVFEDNIFVTSAFFGQLRRAMDKEKSAAGGKKKKR